MTDDIKKVLAEATPRPWIVDDPRPLLKLSWQDRTLAIIVVNSYEADQERIASLERIVDTKDQTIDAQIKSYQSAKERIRVLTEAVMAAAGMFQKGHCLEHFNWGASALRAEDIRELNEVPFTLSAALSPSQPAKESL